MGTDGWYRFPKIEVEKAEWKFFCFEFNVNTGNLKMWQDVNGAYMMTIPELKDLSRKPSTLNEKLIMGKIQTENSVSYKCEEVVLNFGNLQVYTDYPSENINCSSNGNYLGKAYIFVLVLQIL